MNPLVSICMPAYNCAGYIREAVASVLNQDYDNIELIICNDGSTDGTKDILEELKANARIKVIHTANRGQCAAANEAYRHSTGSFVKFFDGDDIMAPEHVASQVERLNDHPDCISSGVISRFYNNDITTALHEPLATWKDLAPADWLLIDNGKGLGMMQCGMFLIPRKILEEEGAWNESLSLINDFEFFPRLLLKAKKILFSDKAVIYYRTFTVNNLSSDTSQEKLLSAYNALEITTNRLLAYENSERARKVLSTYWHLWKYIFYMDAMPLYRKAMEHLDKLGNYPDEYFRKSRGRISKLFGWKNHKKIIYYLKKMRLT